MNAAKAKAVNFLLYKYFLFLPSFFRVIETKGDRNYSVMMLMLWRMSGSSPGLFTILEHSTSASVIQEYSLVLPSCHWANTSVMQFIVFPLLLASMAFKAVIFRPS